MVKATVLVVGSNATRIEIRGGGTRPTGQYLNELVVPAMALIDAGYDIAFATPDGSKPWIDPVSDQVRHFGNDDAAHERGRDFFDTHPAMNRISTLRAAIDAGLDTYAGVFAPGGQAPVVDLMQDADLGEILRHCHEAGKPTALLCHAPIASIAAMRHAREFRAALILGDALRAAELAGGWPYAGYRMTVCPESDARPIEDNVRPGELYFDMSDALRLAGATISARSDCRPYVIEDREVITGENPRSDHALAAALIAALDRARAA